MYYMMEKFTNLEVQLEFKSSKLGIKYVHSWPLNISSNHTIYYVHPAREESGFISCCYFLTSKNKPFNRLEPEFYI